MAAPMWTAIDSNNGYVNTVQEVEALRKHFDLTTSLRLVSLRRTANFGNNTEISKNNINIRWKDVTGAVPNQSVPFVLQGTYERGCMFGRDKHAKDKRKREEAFEKQLQGDHPLPKRRKQMLQGTKKKGCKAAMMVKEVIIFPQFQIFGLTTDLVHSKTVMRCIRICYKLWTVTCSSCGETSVNDEEFNSISLSLTNTLTIHQAVSNFFAAQSIKTNKCTGCKRTGNAEIRTCLVSIPKNIVFHIKRFSNSGRKDMRKLTIIEEIHLRSYVCATKKELLEDKADLFGAILHQGMRRNQGHFFAILRNKMHWFKVDDMKITRISRENALKQIEESYLRGLIRKFVEWCYNFYI